MDPFVKDKLEEWGLMEWSNAFEENFIDEESFLLLDSESLKELIKRLGPRMKAAKKIKELKQIEAACVSQLFLLY
ncbi:hypothetical protein HOLleu_29485 [Holothuria leucospilota]|uniref:SAM domain-containing protein n=1 Tax=Holothuria leucospilota TaxID=206669 RepID=A0A9Q1BNJ3_HOLLE|nr:hypothetical protein HOLleu_29485 [Holothuria leucospilota]